MTITDNPRAVRGIFKEQWHKWYIRRIPHFLTHEEKQKKYLWSNSCPLHGALYYIDSLYTIKHIILFLSLSGCKYYLYILYLTRKITRWLIVTFLILGFYHDIRRYEVMNCDILISSKINCTYFPWVKYLNDLFK